MATGTITSAGLGSGIDVETLITKLMTVEQQPITQIQQQESSIKTRLSAYGTLKSSLSSLQDAAKALSTTEKFAAYSATVANTDAATVTATGSATPGNYSLSVSKLAQNQKVRSGTYASSSSTIATGTLKIDLGTYNGTTFTADSTRSFNITINSSNNTLAGLRDAINSAKAGVTASLVNDGTNTRLVLNSDNTGASNAFKLSGLTGFDFDPAAASTLTSTQSAQDAAFTLDGISMTRASNSVSDALTGITVNLKATTTSATTINITRDTSAIEKKITDFVTAYNNTIGLMASQGSYDTTTKTGGPLNGETSLRSIKSQLRNIVGSTIGSGTVSRLSDIGVQIGVDGKLTVSSTKLEAALADPNKDVSAVFIKGTTTTGIASLLSDRIDDIIHTDGVLTSRTDGLNKTIKNMDSRISSLQSRLSSIEDRYRKQFSAMDSIVAGLNSTSTFLSQQLAKL